MIAPRSFVGAYEAAGYEPDPALRDITKAVVEQFYARLERELRLGLEHGYDVAVSDFDFDPATVSVTARILPLQAGASPPAGRRWTVYATSRGLPIRGAA